LRSAGDQMDYTNVNIGQLNLDAVVDAASAIYREHDRKRTLWDVWSHALHHAAAVAEEIRKLSTGATTDEKLKREVADLALWIFTMLSKLKGPVGVSIDDSETPQDWVVRISVNASELMWNRYPGVCPWCHFAARANGATQLDEAALLQPCRCDELQVVRNKKEKTALRARAKQTRMLAISHVGSRPQSLDKWQDMIRALYHARLALASLPDIALHLLEEMGEVSDGLIRMYTFLERDFAHIEDEIVARQNRLEDELADVLSWLFGLVERMGSFVNNQDAHNSLTMSQPSANERLYLSQILWAEYGSDEKGGFRCRHCEQLACTCHVSLIRDRGQVEELVRRLNHSQQIRSR
jgi:NTP pyrophosphatase (non-canonical NTP hydrolase)